MESVDVAVPVRAAYDQWTQFEEFPRFMDDVDRVEQLDDTRLRWEATIDGVHEEWDAAITEQQPDERIAQVIALRDYAAAPYLVLATRKGLVKKTALTEYDNGRSSGLIAINLREDDSLIGAALISPEDDLLLVSRKAQSIRFHATDDALRPMGRPTSGVIGMKLGDVVTVHLTVRMPHER